jgi:peptide/nickel transport system substrate-binding protein
MKKGKIIILSLIATLIYSCGGENKPAQDSSDTATSTNVSTKLKIGGELHVSELELNNIIDPVALVDAHTEHVSSQVFDGLVTYNPKDLSIQPAVAESWDVSEDGKTYTFHIRKGVYFHDDVCFENGKGREVTAKDVLYTLKRICFNDPENSAFSVVAKDVIVGANDFYKNANMDAELKGVKLVDDYTIEILLEKPNDNILNLLATSYSGIVAKEAVEMYGHNQIVGCGPFILADKNEERWVLKKNPNYYLKDDKGNQLPYLDKVIVNIIPSKQEDLKQFNNDALDILVGLPANSVKKMVQENIEGFENKPPKYILERVPLMASHYLEFNIIDKPLNNKYLRQAINYAINREKIVTDILKGEAYAEGYHGIVPPAFNGYKTTSIVGYNYNPERAKELLEKAGYPDGKGAPKIKLELNRGGAKNVAIALEIQKQLQSVLNLNIETETVSLAQKIKDEKLMKSEIFQTAWIADYPDPLSFLIMFYGKIVPKDRNTPSYPNYSRYQNPKFDELFEKAQNTMDKKERYKILKEAEQIMIEDAPIAVLYYDERFVLIKSNIHQFYPNPMDYRDYSIVYKTEKVTTKKEEVETH